MRENKCSEWSKGLPIVQYIKNRKHHRGIGTSPYNALFGKEAYNGLEIVQLPNESKKKIKTVKELLTILTGIIYTFLTHTHILLLFYYTQ